MLDLGKFLRDRKKQLQGVQAQINPFDNGKTYNTVVNNKQPVQQPQQPQQDTRSTFRKNFDQFNIFDGGKSYNVAMPKLSDHTKWQVDEVNKNTPIGIYKNRDQVVMDKIKQINTPLSSAENSTARKNFYAKARDDRLKNYVGNQQFNNEADAYKSFGDNLAKNGKLDQKQWQNYKDRYDGKTKTGGQGSIEMLKGVLEGKDKYATEALKARVQNNPNYKRSAAQQVISNATGGFTKAVASAPSSINTMAGAALDLVSPEGSRTDKFAETLKNVGASTQQSTNDVYQTKGLTQLQNDNPWTAGLASGAGQIASVVIPGTIVGRGTQAASAISKVNSLLLGANTFAESYRDALKNGASEERALLTATPNAIAQALLEKFGMDQLLKPGGASIIKNAIARSLSEGSQESAQQLIGNIAKNSYDKSQGIWDGVAQSGTMGAILGGGTSVSTDAFEAPAGSLREKIRNAKQNVTPLNDGGYVEVGRTPKNIHPEDQAIMSDFVDAQRGIYKPTPADQQRLEEDASLIAERYGLPMPSTTKELAGVFEQRLQQDKFMAEPVQAQPDPQSMRARIQAAKARVMKPMNEGGYIAGPLALDFSKAKAEGKVFDGVDGKPRFEVDDSGAKLKPEALNPANRLTNLESQYGMMLQMKKLGVNNPDIDARIKAIPEEIRQAKLASKSTKKLKLSDVLDHEQMYAQYPELKDVNVKVVNNRPFETKAAYDPRTNTVELNKKRLDTDPEDVKSNIIHEVQHAIQEKEGFATGGYDKNMDTYKRLAGEAEARAVQARMNMPMSERYVKPEVDPSKAPEKWQGLIKDSREFTNPDDFVNSKQMDYHGTEQSFKRFSNSAIGSRGEPGFTGKGFYFTNRKNYAREYGKNVMEAHLNIKNPYVLDNAPGGFGVPYSPELIKERLKLPSDATPADITKKLKDMGHDGVVVNVIDASGRKKNGFEKMVIDAEDIWNPETLKALHEKTRPRSTFYDSLDVPKEDLIIRNEDGKAMSVDKVDPLESLKQEARKYKSAEEFRKNLIYNDDIIIHQTGKNTADKIKSGGFKSGKETGLGEKRGEVYGMTAYDWNKHGKFSKDTYARDGSGVAEVAIDTKGLKIADRTNQKFTDEEYVKGVHKQIPEGYDGVKVGYGNGVNEVLLKPEVANARRFDINDLYTQSQPPKSTPTVKSKTDIGTLKSNLENTRKLVKQVDRKLSAEFTNKSKNMTEKQKQALMKEYQAKFESSDAREQQKSIEAEIEKVTKSEVADSKTADTVKRLIKESHSQNTYDPKNTGYFVNLSSDNIKNVTPLKGISDYGDSMYVNTNAGVSSVRIQDWSKSGQGFRVSNGNGNDIARFNTDAEARDFARKALTVENEAARQGKRVILNGSIVENRTQPAKKATPESSVVANPNSITEKPSTPKTVEAKDTRKADHWTTPLPDKGPTPIPKKLDSNGVQIKAGDKIEFYGASPDGKKGTSTIRWEGPYKANASGKEFPGQWLGNGTLDNNIPFKIIERDGKPFTTEALPTKTPRPKGLIVSEARTPGGQVTQRIRTKGGKVVEHVVPSTKKFPTLQEFDKTTGGTGAIDSTPQTQTDKRSGKEILDSLDDGSAKDYFDQKDYGVKDIQGAPVNTYSGLFEKYLGVKELSDAELNKSNRTGVKSARDKVGKINPLRALDKGVGMGLEKLSRGGRISRAINRTAQYINKTAGQDPAMIEATKRLAGAETHADAMLVELGKKAYDLIPSLSSQERVHAVIDTEASGGKLKYKDLTKQEQQATDMLRDIGDTINDASFRAGMISRAKWESNRGGRYIARMYSEINNAENVVDMLDLPDSRGLFLGMYKTRVELNDALRTKLIKDPVKLAVIRARQVRSNEALMDFMMTSEKAGYVKSTPTDGFIKVSQEPGQRMHNWNGKYVRQDVYESVNGYKSLHQGANAINNLLDVYDRFPPRKLRKKMLTIYNPVVRTGNITSNYFFAYLNGVNPATFLINKSWAKKALKNDDQLVVEARRAGLIGSDIVSRDKNMFDSRKEFMRDVNKLTSQKLGDKVKGVDDTMSNRYGKADDIAKLAALKAHTDRGYSIKQAIEKTSRGFQDYSRVGHLYDMAAKSPVFGNAFIRFQGDLYTNILKNAAVDHPARLASIPFATLLLGNALSALSGESEEDKKTREDRLGAPKIPFTNISTEFQTPWGAVDLARFTPLYMRNVLTDNEGDGSNKKGFMDDLSRLSPVNLPSNLSPREIARASASDPLIGPLISLATDTDWRGKSVKDPDGMRDGKALFPDDKLSKAEEWRNRAQYGLRSYLPYPFNEVGDIMASAGQDKKNEQTAPGSKNDPFNPNATPLGRVGYNTSGSKKTVGQSAARLIGIRAQQYGSAEAKDQRERNDMFSFFGRVDKFKETLDDQTKKAFDARHKSNATRSGLKKEFVDDPWYKYKNAGELLQNPKLFEAEKKYAKMQNEYDKRPIDPIFDLPPEQRNIVLAKKLKLPGSKDEGFNTLYDQEWYQNFRGKQDKYYAAKDRYKAKLGFADPKETNPYPEAKKDVQKLMDTYFSLPDVRGAKSAWIRSNPDAWNAITAQWDKQNAWTDKEREVLGLPKIARDDDKYNYGSGKGGGRGKKASTSLADYYSLQSTTNKRLRQLLAGTTFKGSASKAPTAKKVAQKKITVNTKA